MCLDKIVGEFRDFGDLERLLVLLLMLFES